MKKVIESWAFLESILPGEVPVHKEKIRGKNFEDGLERKRINPLSISWDLLESVRPANPEKYFITFTYYIDCYEYNDLVQLLRSFFNSNEEIVNRSSKICYGFTFKVNESGKYIEDSLFIPHLQLIINDIKTKQSIQYNTFIERYHEARSRVEEAASSVFSDNVSPDGIQKLRQIFYKYFSAPYKKENYGFVEISLENKRNPQSTAQFNSFYIEDLHQILEKDTNQTLQQFIEGKPLKVNIDENKKEISKILLPDNLPLGRWPSPIGHRLSLMQQVAVNQILNGNEKICSVNGPPGTGKTTLLKDVFAQIIVDRTIQMVSYQDPTSAFSKMGKFKVDKYDYNMYELDEEIAKYSIVVASSNNGAVENISKDLPRADSFFLNSEEPTEKEYQDELAQTGADVYYRHKCERIYSEEAIDLDLFSELSSEVIQDEKAWGLFSAALGRSSNLSSVSKALNGLRAKPGQPKLISLAERLKQPLPSNAWEDVVIEFNELKQSVERKKKELQQFAKLTLQVEDIILDKSQTDAKLEKVSLEQQEIEHLINRVDTQKQLVKEQLSNFPMPTLWEKFTQLFSKKIKEEEESVRQELHLLIEEQKRLKKNSYKYSQIFGQLTKEAHKLDERLAEIARLKGKYHNQQLISPTEDYWNKEMYEERQKSVLWQTDELNFERGLLFLKALKVHKVFLMLNAKSIKAALAIFSNKQSINMNIDINRKYVSNMWNIMHLIFPVISSTFASFGLMYRGMEKDFIGYLFVDEAGQASPQQAAGALWRSKRAIIVGDPIQIEPVVSIDETILHDIRRNFNVSAEQIGMTASVQTLADLANPIGTYKGQGEGRQRIGIPLWVHRRCSDPMFSIANRIAYQNKMVLADKKIGRGYWHNCVGNAVHSQYVKEQGDFILEKVRAHFGKTNEKEPNVFIITPFTAVKESLKNLLIQKLKGESTNISKWVERSVGTVHTFQGKEAEIVYFVTGTDAQTDGAANWSCVKPNLLNVAATRAKKEFYIVGDLARFSTKQHYDVIQQTFEEFNNKKLYFSK